MRARHYSGSIVGQPHTGFPGFPILLRFFNGELKTPRVFRVSDAHLQGG
jgi:hypothetical protein